MNAAVNWESAEARGMRGCGNNENPKITEKPGNKFRIIEKTGNDFRVFLFGFSNCHSFFFNPQPLSG